MSKRCPRRLPALALLCAAMMMAACDHSTAPSPDHGTVQMHLQASFTAAPVQTLVVTISAADITPSLIYNLPVSNNTASGTVTIPVGKSRLISLAAYDASGTKTYAGSQTVDVLEGTNPTVSIVLSPLTGQEPITATLQTFTVTVSPTTASVTAGLTTTIAVTVKGSDGSTITPAAGSVTCATSNPAIATVPSTATISGSTANCVATGVLAGNSATIMATYSGVGASAAVTVQ